VLRSNHFQFYPRYEETCCQKNVTRLSDLVGQLGLLRIDERQA